MVLPSFKTFGPSNGFHLSLQIRQGAAIGYTVSVLLSNIWACMRRNQTKIRLACAPPTLEEYLQLIPANHETIESEKRGMAQEVNQKERHESGIVVISWAGTSLRNAA